MGPGGVDQRELAQQQLEGLKRMQLEAEMKKNKQYASGAKHAT